MTIDDMVPAPWPEHVVTALDQWRQGHLIRGNLCVWLGVGGAQDPVTGDDFSNEGEALTAATAGIGDTGYMAIVSQTCDIAATGPGMRHPFIQVCPVRDIGTAFSTDKVNQIRDGEVVEYVYLTAAPELTKEWAVDLRLSVPVSKGVLVARQPIEGFASEEDELVLAARIAAKFERPALHDYLSKELVNDFTTFLSTAKRSEEWCDDVEQLRLEIEGSRLAPKRIRLIVVTDIDLDRADREPLRNRWNSHKKRLRAAGIAQAPIAFRRVDKMRLEEYRGSIPLNLPTLQRGRFA